MRRVNPLTRYALSGLERCWMSGPGRWSHKYHLDGRNPPNQSLPHSDLYYSLNVLLGMAKVQELVPDLPYDIPGLLVSLCDELPRHPVRNGAWGMALWAAAELGLDTPAIAAARLRRVAADPSLAAKWTAQDLGLSLSGATAQARQDSTWRPLARALSEMMLGRFRGPRALFRDGGEGLRKHFGTFATQVYAALSLYQWAELADDPVALAAANGCASKLIELQGRFGEWPWFYLPHSDRILDPYEVYSVHQHGMAPAVMHHATEHNVPGARNAIVNGFRWIFGTNEMGVSMLRPDLKLIYRSQRRRNGDSRQTRLARAAFTAVTGTSPWTGDRPALRLTEEMRSYEFGWLLWSFGARTDYPELTQHAEFGMGDAQSEAAVSVPHRQTQDRGSLGCSIRLASPTSV